MHASTGEVAGSRRDYLVSHDWLLDGGQVFERRQQDVAPLRPPDVLDEAAELLAQGDQDLVFILDRLCDATLGSMLSAGELVAEVLTIQEGDELFSRALGTEGKGDSREPVNGVEPEEDVVVLDETRSAHAKAKTRRRAKRDRPLPSARR